MDNDDNPEDRNSYTYLFKGPGRGLFHKALGGTNMKKKAPAPALREDQLKEMFKRYDMDGDGRLNKKELKNAFNALGSRLPVLRAALALNHADANGDGVIDQSEFETLVKDAYNRGYTGRR